MAALIRALEDDPAIKLRRRLIAGGAIALVVAGAARRVAGGLAPPRRGGARDCAGTWPPTEAADVGARPGRRDRRASCASGRSRRSTRMDQRRGRVAVAADARAAAGDRRRVRPGRTGVRDRVHARPLARRVPRAARGRPLRAPAVRRGLSSGRKAQVLQERLRAVDVDGSSGRRSRRPGRRRCGTTPARRRTSCWSDTTAMPTTGRRTAMRVAGVRSRALRRLPPAPYRLDLRRVRASRAFCIRSKFAAASATDVDLALPCASSRPRRFRLRSRPASSGSATPTSCSDRSSSERFPFTGAQRRVPDRAARNDVRGMDRIPERAAAVGAAGKPARRVDRRCADRCAARRCDGGWQLALPARPRTRYFGALRGISSIRGTDAARPPGLAALSGRRHLARRTGERLPRVAAIARGGCRARGCARRPSGSTPRAAPTIGSSRTATTSLPDDANFDVTYGRVDIGVRPRRGRSHPASRSPFGVDDMVGNVFELAMSSLKPNEMVIRGGSLLLRGFNARSTNREAVPRLSRRGHGTPRLRISARGNH